ncbi:uncharacterized protein [Asterias amurensis]|uniref:uncharacterized protein n=1 Tax=Asterias amurensis TaxID=7602 RepID=UPI003AB8544C
MAEENEDVVATDYCKNCKRDIPSVNYVTHQTHCSRNIVLCNQCKEPVPRSEMEEHNDEYHAKVTCKCGEAVEKCKQEEHDAEHCPQRQVQCEYCEMDMDHKSLTEHKDFCGSRTDPCPLCSRYIFFRDKARHEESICQYPEVKPVKPNPVKTLSLSSLSTNQRQTNPFGIGSLDSTEALHQQQELFDQFPGARNRGPFTAGRGGNARDMRRAFSEETDDDRKHRKNHDRIQNIMAKNGARSIEKNEERALLQSMVNQEDSDESLANHLAQDLYYDATPFPTDHQFQSAGLDFSDNVDIHGIMKEGYGIPAINTFRYHSSDLTLPCEFCLQQIPVESLIEHQTGCRPDISCHPIPDSSLANNSRQRSHHQSHPPQPPSDTLNNLGYGSLPSGYSSSSFGQQDNSLGYLADNLTMLPCEFCDVLLPADAIPMHQVNCVENRTETPLPATFDTAPGAYPTQRGGAVESLIRPNPQRGQRPQDFAALHRPKKYPEQHPVIDPSVDDDDDEDDDVDVIPVKMDKSSSHSQYPRKAHHMAPTFQQQRTHPLGHSAADKYLHRGNRGGHGRPSALVTGHPIEGAVPKPKTNNTAGQSRHFEQRPQSKSSTKVQETLKSLCDTPVLLDGEEELNNVVGGRLNSRLGGGEQDSYPPGNNRTKSSKANLSSFGPSGVETDNQTAAPFQTRSSLAYNNLPRQPLAGARQKVSSRKPHMNNSRSSGHGDGYDPSFARGESQTKGRERFGHSGNARRAKQPSASTTVAFDPKGLIQSTALQVKGESPISRTSNQKSSQKRRPAAPRQNTRHRDDSLP